MAISPYYLIPPLPEGLEGLAEAGLDLRWSWSHATDPLWERIDPELWNLTRNPWLILQSVSFSRLKTLAREPAFRKQVDEALKQQVFEVQVYLNGIDPNSMRVELYADGVDGEGPVRREMTRVRQRVGATGGTVYRARVPAVRPATDYTARVIPLRSGVAVPLENARILWQR
jgi:hypothetical protein